MILVTGGTGMVGSHILLECVKKMNPFVLSIEEMKV